MKPGHVDESSHRTEAATRSVLKDYLRYVSKYSLFDPNIAIIYEKDNLYKHFSLVCSYILVCFSGHLC